MPGKQARRKVFCARDTCDHAFPWHINPTPEGWVDQENTQCNAPDQSPDGNCNCPKFKWADDD